MYALIDPDYEIVLTAHDEKLLEEIALSIFEEVAFDWFNCFVNSDEWDAKLKELPTIKNYSYQVAKENILVKIIKLPAPID